MHYHWSQTAAKKPNVTILNISCQAKNSNENLTMVGWNNSRVVNIASSKSSKPKIFVWRLKNNFKKVYLRTITKLIPLFQPEHRFSRQNGSGLCQVND